MLQIVSSQGIIGFYSFDLLLDSKFWFRSANGADMLYFIFQISIISLLTFLAVYIKPNQFIDLKKNLISLCFVICLLLPFIPKYWSTDSLINNDTSYSSDHFIAAKFDSEQVYDIKTQELISNQSSKFTNQNAKLTSFSLSQIFLFLFLFLWIIGSLFQLKQVCKQHLLIRKMLSHSNKVIIKDKFKIKKQINFHISACTHVPFVYVTFKSIEIFFPSQFNEWSKQEINTVILHELCHYKRKDHLSIWLSNAISVLFWFHPILLLLVSMQKDLIEMGCDNQLIENGIDEIEYAETLLSLSKNGNTFSVVATMSDCPKLLTKRITNILKNTPNKLNVLTRFAYIGIASVLVLCSCMNVNTLTESSNLIQFISHDIPSFKSGKIDKHDVLVSTFYDGVDNGNTFIELEISSDSIGKKSWLKLGPLMKFNQQIQTWHYSLKDDAVFTGKYKISGVVPDGIVDGVGLGIVYVQQNGQTNLYKSIGVLDQKYPNFICSWPLGMPNEKIRLLSPQVSKEHPDEVKRMICGSQLLNNGYYSISQI